MLMGDGVISLVYFYDTVASVAKSTRIYRAYKRKRVGFRKRHVSVTVKGNMSSHVCRLIKKGTAAEAYVEAVAVAGHKGNSVDVLIGNVFK